MQMSLSTQRERGLTLVELLVVMAIIGVLAVVFILPANSRPKGGSYRIRCVNNLKQTGVAFRVWEGDHGDKYPMSVSETNGGTMEFTAGPDLWRHFQVMSNELSTPKVLICPADESRNAATNFTFLRNSNISFFIGLDANETNPQLILSGDRLTNGTALKNGILEVSSNHPAAWTAEVHNKVGNILLSDGSVQQVSITGLRSAIENTGLATNRLQMPVLEP
jgi:prepilin-type N-terminal cleavage/methylation domain-containing protein